jgi:hypothetical protein
LLLVDNAGSDKSSFNCFFALIASSFVISSFLISLLVIFAFSFDLIVLSIYACEVGIETVLTLSNSEGFNFRCRLVPPSASRACWPRKAPGYRQPQLPCPRAPPRRPRAVARRPPAPCPRCLRRHCSLGDSACGGGCCGGAAAAAGIRPVDTGRLPERRLPGAQGAGADARGASGGRRCSRRARFLPVRAGPWRKQLRPPHLLQARVSWRPWIAAGIRSMPCACVPVSRVENRRVTGGVSRTPGSLNLSSHLAGRRRPVRSAHWLVLLAGRPTGPGAPGLGILRDPADPGPPGPAGRHIGPESVIPHWVVGRESRQIILTRRSIA